VWMGELDGKRERTIKRVLAFWIWVLELGFWRAIGLGLIWYKRVTVETE